MLHIAWLKNSSDPTHGIEDGNERVYDPKKGLNDLTHIIDIAIFWCKTKGMHL